MKSKILILMSAVFLMAGCKKDYLDKYPLDQLEDNSFWTSEANVKTYSWNFYPRYFAGYGSGNVTGWGGFFTGEALNDDVAGATQFTLNPTTTSSSWNASFTWIRRANLMHERVQGMTGLSADVKNHWLGTARFFRALEYANRVSEFGDYPWFDKALAPEDPTLYKPRDSRTFVMDKVLEDFRFAVENVKTGDDRAVVDKYTVLALMSRVFLFEGTWQKYHLGNTAKATEYLEAAKWAANEVIASNKFSLANSYRTVFNSADLANSVAKPEIILYRRYELSLLMHSLMSYHSAEPQTGYSKSAVDSYLAVNGLPIGLSAAGTFDGNVKTGSALKAKAMIGRDPRINATFADSLRIVNNVAVFGNSTSGYASIKFLDETAVGTTAALSGTNISDAPQVRYAEVLLNYAEAATELGTLTQADLDKTINKLRNRSGFANKLPNLQVIGGLPAVNGSTYDDPKRDATVSSLLWEIRRERRVELLMEGFRNDDLRRWKKLEYADQVLNRDANRGAYIKLSDFAKKPTGLKIENDAVEGYIQPVQSEASFRKFYNQRVYLAPIGTDEIRLYKDNGATLAQNPGW